MSKLPVSVGLKSIDKPGIPAWRESKPLAPLAVSMKANTLVQRQAARVLHEVERMSGIEIARLPRGSDAECVSDARATYARTKDGLRLLSLCRRENGSTRRSTGRAKLADDATQARFKISYSHSALDPLPFVWSDYTIIDVADDYSTAIVGAADRKHLWLLSRQPSVGDSVRQDFLNKARAQGFDTSALIYTRHSA